MIAALTDISATALNRSAKELIDRFLVIDEIKDPSDKGVQFGLWAEDVRAYKRRKGRVCEMTRKAE